MRAQTSSAPQSRDAGLAATARGVTTWIARVQVEAAGAGASQMLRLDVQASTEQNGTRTLQESLQDTPAAAASVPYAFDARASQRRRLLDASAATGQPALWLDLQADGVVNNLDSQALYQIARLATTNEAGGCQWLGSIYQPSQYGGGSLAGNRFNDSSFTSSASPTWIAVDPKLLYLRTRDSPLLRPGDSSFATACVAGHGINLSNEQFVPLLPRPDGTAPLSRELLDALLPVGLDYATLMQIDLVRDVKMYQVRVPLRRRSHVHALAALFVARARPAARPRRRGAQEAMLGNTAFLTGCEATAVANRFDLVCTVRNDASLLGFDQTSFWPGFTQLFIEMLALESGDGAVPMADFGEFTFVHEVWNALRLSYAAASQPGGALTGSTPRASNVGHLCPTARSLRPRCRARRPGCLDRTREPARQAGRYSHEYTTARGHDRRGLHDDRVRSRAHRGRERVEFRAVPRQRRGGRSQIP